MHYQEVLKMPESIPYLLVGFDVGIDFTWMSIVLLNGIFIDKPFKTIYSDLQSRELVISKIKEAQEMHSPEGRYFLESAGIHHIPLLCFLRDKGFDCAVINPIITKSSTNMNVRKLHNDKFDSKEAAKAGLDISLKVSIVPDDVIINLHDFVRDYYYFKDLRSAIVLKLHAELKVSFPVYLSMLNKATTQTSLKLLEVYPPAVNMPVAPKDELVETIRSTACFGETYAPVRYDTIYTTAEDVAVSGRTFPSNALRIRLYMKVYREYQAHLDSILGELHQAAGKLEGTPDYGRISFVQTLHNIGFLSVVVLVAEIGAFDLFSSPKKLYTYFGLDPGVSDSDKFHGDGVYTSKRGSGLVRRVPRMVAVNSLRVDKATRTPTNPVIYDYYTRKCANKKESVAVGTVIHRICNIIFAMPRDNKPFELVMPEEYHEHYAAEHPESVNPAA